MPVATVLENEDELVPAAIQRAHAPIVLDPDAEIFEPAVGVVCGAKKLLDMAPVHTDEVDRAVSAVKAARFRQAWARKAMKPALSISPEAITKGR